MNCTEWQSYSSSFKDAQMGTISYADGRTRWKNYEISSWQEGRRLCSKDGVLKLLHKQQSFTQLLGKGEKHCKSPWCFFFFFFSTVLHTCNSSRGEAFDSAGSALLQVSGRRESVSVEAGSEVGEGPEAVSPFSHTQCFLSTSALGRGCPGAILQTPAPSDALHGVAAKTRVRGHVTELEDCPPHHPIGHVEGRSAGDPCTTAAQIEGGSGYFLHSFIRLNLPLTPAIQTFPHVWNIHL